MSNFIQFVDKANGRWTIYSREGEEGEPFRFNVDTYVNARTQRLALDGITDRVQVLDGMRRKVLDELAREPGDQGALRPVENLTQLGIVGELPEEDAVPISREVLNGRNRHH